MSEELETKNYMEPVPDAPPAEGLFAAAVAKVKSLMRGEDEHAAALAKLDAEYERRRAEIEAKRVEAIAAAQAEKDRLDPNRIAAERRAAAALEAERTRGRRILALTAMADDFLKKHPKAFSNSEADLVCSQLSAARSVASQFGSAPDPAGWLLPTLEG